jgi:hypothetical protein
LILQIETIFLVINTEKESRIDYILCKKWGRISVTFWLLNYRSSIPAMLSASEESAVVTLSALVLICRLISPSLKMDTF